MKQNVMVQVYDSLTRRVAEKYRIPGVEDAFAPGAYCWERYGDMLNAYARLCDRLGVEDEDEDVEVIINALMDIQDDLCYKMYRYGAMFEHKEK